MNFNTYLSFYNIDVPYNTGVSSILGNVNHISVTSWEPNRLDVFYQGIPNQNLYHKAWDGGSWQPSLTKWEYWVAGSYRSCAVSWGPNRLDIFGIIEINRPPNTPLNHKAWDGSRWRPSIKDWESLAAGSQLQRQPFPGVLIVWMSLLEVTTKRSIIRPGMVAVGSLSLTGWENLGGQIFGNPAAVSWGPNRLDIFAVGVRQSALS